MGELFVRLWIHSYLCIILELQVWIILPVFLIYVSTKISFRVTHSKALRDRLEARVPDLLNLNTRAKPSDLGLRRASQFDL